jgi:hypothetical protein
MALLPAVIFSCVPDFPQPPASANIGCRTSEDCPTGWTCIEATGKCVEAEKVKDPPSLSGAPSISPAILKTGATAMITFTSNRELSDTPVVVVKIAGVSRIAAFDEKNSSGNKYAFTYTAAGDETQGVENPVTVVMTDTYGSRSAEIPLGTLKFDFVTPSVSDVSLIGSPVTKNRKVTLSFFVNKDLSKDPVVSLPGERTFTKVATEGRKHTYEYLASEVDTEGKAQVKVDIEDDAGNTAGVSPAEVEFDFTSPGLKSGPSVNVGYARLDTLIEVMFEADEPLSAVNRPVVKLGGIMLSPSDQAGQTYRYSHTAKVEDIADGVLTKSLSIEFEDLAGNTTSLLMPEKAVTFMVLPPALVPGSFSVTPNKANASREITARFKVCAPRLMSIVFPRKTTAVIPLLVDVA